jgi:hypothetical protein
MFRRVKKKVTQQRVSFGLEDLSFSFDLLSLELLLVRVVVNPAAVLRAYVIALWSCLWCKV